MVRAFPVLTVTVDGQPKGDVPVHLKLPAGPHTLKLTNSETKYSEKLKVEILENQTVTIERMK